MDGETYGCINSDETECQYSQPASNIAAYPAIDPEIVWSVPDASTIVLTGANLDYTGFELSVNLTNVTPDTITIDSATQITLTFALGAPIQLPAIVLIYKEIDGILEYHQEEWNMI